MLKNLILATFVLAPVAFVACADDGPSEERDDQDIIVGTAPSAFVGSYSDPTQGTQDFGTLELKADGRYVARVLTAVVKAQVACVVGPCNIGEQGGWSISRAGDGVERLRLKPDTTPVRIYVVSKPVFQCSTFPCPNDTDRLKLERRASVQVMQRAASSPTDRSCQSLGGQCRTSPSDPGFPANCKADFASTPLAGKCPAVNQTCCSPAAEPASSCQSLGGECRSSPADPTFPALCMEHLGVPMLPGACPAINEACCAPQPTIIPPGTWGAEQAILNAKGGSARIEFDCASAQIDAFTVTSATSFTATGTHTRSNGFQPPPDLAPKPQPATFKGKISGKQLTLEMTVEGETTKMVFTQDKETVLRRCL